MEKVLFLVSGSKSRVQLLKEAGIEFRILNHNSNENIRGTGLAPKDYVAKIAVDKMEHADLTGDLEVGSEFLALSADTLVFASNGQIIGKPKDKADAERIVKILRANPINVFSGCCLRKFIVEEAGCKALSTEIFHGQTELFFYLSDKAIEVYFSKVDYLSKSGAFGIEDFGAQFVEWIRGSYTNVRGLPIFELRQNLVKAGFLDY